MKKAIIFVIAVCFIVSFSTGIAYAAELQSNKGSTLSMQVMGKTLTGIEPPLLQNGKVYVPMRFAAEALGYTVTYNPSTRIMDIKKDNHSIRLTIGSVNTVVNGKTVKIEKAPFLNKGRAYVPIDYIKTAFGVEAKYDSNKRLVSISEGNSTKDTLNPVKKEGIYTLGKKQTRICTLVRNHVMIPVRPIGEGLGYKVEWNIKTQIISLKKLDRLCHLR